MKHHALFSSKDKSKKLICCLLQFLFGALRVRTAYILHKQVEEGANNSVSPDGQEASQAPRGRWAQRVDNQGIAVKSQDGKTIEVDLATGKK